MADIAPRPQLTWHTGPHGALVLVQAGGGVDEEEVHLALGQREGVAALAVPPPVALRQALAELRRRACCRPGSASYG